jgi:hypothetical protein
MHPSSERYEHLPCLIAVNAVGSPMLFTFRETSNYHNWWPVANAHMFPASGSRRWSERLRTRAVQSGLAPNYSNALPRLSCI